MTDQIVPEPEPGRSSREAGYCEAIVRIEPEIAFLVRMLDVVYRRRGYPMQRAHYLLMLRLLEGPRTSGELAMELVLDHSTVTRQISAVEKCGFVRRRVNPDDGRSALFEATDLGVAQCALMRRLRLERLTIMLGDWEPEERRRFADYVSRLNKALLAMDNAGAFSMENYGEPCGQYSDPCGY
ncbi:MarR family transcriptional regulator [Breoghania sp.]|uniref:MarR family winged helix-turn-helix transcriptional regulator n=1 Tax=Breoghania sp. TaxID=2065378 RepID=UPI002AAAFFF3|nr:MarR family transcriptional regulator [Breoghania sp.]